MDRILTARELAPLLRCSERSIRNAINRGDIRGEKVAGRWLVNASREFHELLGVTGRDDRGAGGR